MATDKKEETKISKEELTRDNPNIRRNELLCKVCNKWKSLDTAHKLVCMQKNSPLDFPHVRFSSKSEVIICDECFRGFKKVLS